MLNFFKSKPVVAVEPEETVEAGRERRRNELREELHAVTLELKAIADAALRFLRENTTSINGHFAFVASSITGRSELESQWQRLMREDYRLNQRRNVILSELADIKIQGQTCFIGGALAQNIGGIPQKVTK